MIDAETEPDPLRPGSIAFIGFGEAASAFLAGWRADFPGLQARAFDIKTDATDPATRDAKRADFRRAGVAGTDSCNDALAGATMVFSLVTADQAEAAAAAAAGAIGPGALFLDGNSCSPGAKRRSAALIERAGARYADVAIMAPVHPRLSKTPLLVAGGAAAAAKGALDRLGMDAAIAGSDVGSASSIKMIRSIMVKGLEALVAECVLAGRLAGVEDKVLASLDDSYPGFGWEPRAAYMLERMMTHGVRRAAEMREVAATIAELGLPPDLAGATVHWQQRLGDLRLDAKAAGDSAASRADAILRALGGAARQAAE